MNLGNTLHEKIELEQVQYEAALLETGLTLYVSIGKLIKEIGCLSLSDKRPIQTAVTMFKKNGYETEYLYYPLSPIVAERTNNEMQMMYKKVL